MRYDPITGNLAVAIAEAAEPGRKLRFTVGVVDTPDAGGGGQDRARVSFGPQDNMEPGSAMIYLRDPGQASSTCTVSCRNGEWTITCDNKGCKAYCSAGQPICVCTNKIQA